MISVKFRQRRYSVLSRFLGPKNRGLCDPPTDKSKMIQICSSVKNPELLLDTLLHEGLHACFYDLDEDSIESAAASLTRLLTRLGVRLDTEKVHAILRDQRGEKA